MGAAENEATELRSRRIGRGRFDFTYIRWFHSLAFGEASDCGPNATKTAKAVAHFGMTLMTASAEPTTKFPWKSGYKSRRAGNVGAGQDNTSFPPLPLTYPSSASHSSLDDASCFELEAVRPLDTHTPRSRFRNQPKHDRIALLMVAGMLVGGEAIELTINIPAGSSWPKIRRKLVRALRAAGWSGRHVWVEVKAHTRPNGTPVQHHVHVALFDSGIVQNLLEEMRFGALIARKRSFSIRHKSPQQIANYLYKNLKWDKGEIGADKKTHREAEALSKLTARQLWDLWRETAPCKVDSLPEVPPILAAREAVHTVTLKPRRKRAATKAAKAHERDLRRIDRSGSLSTAQPVPLTNPPAESKEADQAIPGRDVATPTGAAPVGTPGLDCRPADGGDVPAEHRQSIFGDFDLAEDNVGAFELAAGETGAFDLLLVYDRSAASALRLSAAKSTPG